MSKVLSTGGGKSAKAELSRRNFRLAVVVKVDDVRVHRIRPPPIWNVRVPPHKPHHQRVPLSVRPPILLLHQAPQDTPLRIMPRLNRSVSAHDVRLVSRWKLFVLCTVVGRTHASHGLRLEHETGTNEGRHFLRCSFLFSDCLSRAAHKFSLARTAFCE